MCLVPVGRSDSYAGSRVCARAKFKFRLAVGSLGMCSVPIAVPMPPGDLPSHFSGVGEALVHAFLFFFSSKCRKKKVFILIIKISLFCILQYISNISTRKHSRVQRGQAGDSICQDSSPGEVVRRRTCCSRTWPPSRPPPRRTTHPCIRRSISAACSAGDRSTGPPRTRLCTPAGTPSWLSGKRRSPAVSGNNLWSAPLGRRLLGKNTAQTVSHAEGVRIRPGASRGRLSFLSLLLSVIGHIGTGGVACCSLKKKKKNTSLGPLFSVKIVSVSCNYYGHWTDKKIGSLTSPPPPFFLWQKCASSVFTLPAAGSVYRRETFPRVCGLIY